MMDDASLTFRILRMTVLAVSKNLLIKLRDVIPGTFIQPLSTGVIHLTFSVQYLQNKQSSWLTVLAAY